MAETYKGLTIRIGGETTGLQRALKSADSAIASTNTNLRKMTQALRMDPSSTKAMQTQVELMGDKLVEASNRATKLRDALKDVNSQKVEFQIGDKLYRTEETVEQLKAGTKDLSQFAAEAKSRYNEINAELEKLYRSVNSAAKETGKFNENFDLRKCVNQLENIEDYLVQTGAATEDQIAKIKAYRDAWADAAKQNAIGEKLTQVRDLESELTKANALIKQTATQLSKAALETSRIELTGGIDERFKRLSAAAAEADRNVENLRKAVKMDPGNIDTIREAMEGLRESSVITAQEITTLETKIGILRSKGIGDIADKTLDAAQAADRLQAKYEESSTALSQVRAELQKAEAEQQKLEDSGDTMSDGYKEAKQRVASLTDEVQKLEAANREAFDSANTAQMVKELKEAESTLTTLRSKYKELNQAQRDLTSPKEILSSNTLMELGMTLSTSVTPAILAMGYSAIESANEIDSAYRNMRKTVNGTEADFENLREAAVEFSATHVTSADQILEIQAIGGELGVAVEDLETFATTVSNLEVATDLDADEAATALGQLDNILTDLNGDTMPAFSDALVRLGNNGASTESQIVEIAKRIGSMGSIVGMTTPEILAWASSIASTGQNAEAAGTAISNTMSDLETAVAAGGDSLEAFAQVSGMTAQEFADTWNSDPSTAMRAFIEGLVKIEDSGGSADATLQDLGITAVRQKQAIEGLMQTIGGLDDNLKMSNNAWNGVSDQWGEAGDAANEAEKKAEGFSGSLARMQNVAQVLGAEMGESLAPAIDFVADLLGELTVWFTSLPDAAKQAIAVIGGISAAAGPIFMYARAFGSLSKDLKGISTALKVMSGVSDVAGASVSTLGGSFSLLGPAMGIAAVGVGAIIAEMSRVQEQVEKSETSISELRKAVGNTSGALIDGAGSLEDYGDAAEDTAVDLTEVYDANLELAKNINETNEQTAAQIGSLRNASSIIDEYANQSGLTAEEQGKLRAAIDQVNQVCGTQYSVVDAANGKISDEEGAVLDTVDALHKYIDAKIAAIQADAMATNLQNAMETEQKQIEANKKALDEYNKNIDDYEEKWGTRELPENASLEQNHDWGEVEKAKDGFEETADAANEASAAVDQLAEDYAVCQSVAEGTANELQTFAVNSRQIGKGLTASGKGIASFTDSLDRAGVSVEKLQELSEEELEQLASDFDGTVNSVVDSLDGMGKDLPAKGLGIVLGFSDGISQGTADAVNAALNVSNMTVEEFGKHVQDYGFEGEEAITAYANELAKPDATAASAAIAAYGGVEGIGSMLASYGIEGTEAVNAFIAAIQSGDTYNAALEKANSAASGIHDGGVNMTSEASTANSNTESALTSHNVDLYSEWSSFVGGIASAISSAMAAAYDTASYWVGRIASILASTPTSPKGTGGGFSGGGGGGVSGGGGGGTFQSLSATPMSARSRAVKAVSQPSVTTDAETIARSMAASARYWSPSKANLLNSSMLSAAVTASQLSVSTDRRNTGGYDQGTNGVRTPPYPGSGIRETGNSAVNITIDGIGTTGRVQSIALDLLDELERVGAI